MVKFLSFLAVAGAAFSARWNWWRAARPGIPILMYHKVGTPPAGSKLKKLWVAPGDFREQLAYIADKGYHPVTFAELYSAWDAGVSLPSKPVLITFDDGYLNNFSEALPILQEFGFRATIFVVTNTLGGDNRWHDPASETRISMLSWDQVRALQKAGWEIGSHTLNHPHLPGLALDEARREIEESRVALAAQLGEPPQTFAYPYGAGEDDPRIRELARVAGYRSAVGVHAGKWTLEQAKSSPYNLPRVFVRGGETMLDFHLQMTRGRSRL